MAKPESSRSEVTFSLNGKLVQVAATEATGMLADFLRKNRSLCGTKIVCAEGDCGACTVLKAAPFQAQKKSKPEFIPVNSCIIPVSTLDGSQVITVEGLAEGSKLHPVQEAMVRCHGSQCGFCTPGFVMAMTGLVEKKLSANTPLKKITEKEAKNALTANLCRCTGYSPIVNAACSIELKKCTSVRPRVESPAILKELKKATATPLLMQTEDFTSFAPTSLDQAAVFFKKNPDAVLVSGATDLGVVHNKRKKKLSHYLSLHLIPDLYSIRKKGKNTLLIGSRVTLSEVRSALKSTTLSEFSNFLDLFASPQIKNQATLVGNLANASPIGDTPPFLLVAGTKIHTYHSQGKGKARFRVHSIEEFFLGYRKTALLPGEWITAIELDLPAASEILRLKKVSQRKDLDISTVNAAFRVKWNPKRTELKEIKVAWGGVAATPTRSYHLENFLKDKSLVELDLNEVCAELHRDITPIDDLRGTAAFRRVTAENLLRQFLKELNS